MSNLNAKKYRELLEDICQGYCKEGHYCILKEFLVSSHPSPRLLMQLKCIDKYKFEESKKVEGDIKWDGAIKMWVDSGLAKRFADEYNEEISFSVLYKRVRNG